MTQIRSIPELVQQGFLALAVFVPSSLLANEPPAPEPAFARGKLTFDLGYGLGAANGPAIAEQFDPSLNYANAARLSLAENKLKNLYGAIMFLNYPDPSARIESFSLEAEYGMSEHLGLGVALDRSRVWLRNAPKRIANIPTRSLSAFIPIAGSCDGIANPGSLCNPGILDNLSIQLTNQKLANLDTAEFNGAFHLPFPYIDCFARASIGGGSLSGQQVIKAGLSAGVRVGQGPVYLLLQPFANYYQLPGKGPGGVERSIRETGFKIGVSSGFALR